MDPENECPLMYPSYVRPFVCLPVLPFVWVFLQNCSLEFSFYKKLGCHRTFDGARFFEKNLVLGCLSQTGPKQVSLSYMKKQRVDFYWFFCMNCSHIKSYSIPEWSFWIEILFGGFQANRGQNGPKKDLNLGFSSLTKNKHVECFCFFLFSFFFFIFFNFILFYFFFFFAWSNSNVKS